MINYKELLNKNVRVISVVFFTNGRKIKTEYNGILFKNSNTEITLRELDGTLVSVQKKFIKRIEEYYA